MMYKKKKLGGLVDIGSSKRVYAQEYVDEGIPFYRSKEIIEKAQGREISNPLYISLERFEELRNKHGAPKNGDLLLTSVGTLGIPYIVRDEEFYFKDGNLTWFNNFQNLDNMYLYYWFNSTFGKAEINKRLIGSTQKALTITNLKEFEIYLPDNYIQKKIVNILSSFDDKIEINNAIIANLEEQAKVIFSMNFLSKVSQEKQNNKVVKLGDLFKFVKGKKPKEIKEVNQKDHVPYLVKKYIDSGEVSYVHYSDGIFIEDLDVFMLMDGANSGNIYYGYKGILGSTFSLLENEHDMINEYLYWYLLINQDSIRKQNTGSAIPHANKDYINTLEVSLPEDLKENKILKTLQTIRKYSINLRRENDKLRENRDLILPKLMSGEIRIEETIEVEEM